MNGLPKDLIRHICVISELEVGYKLSQSNSDLNDLVFNNPIFWMNKLEYDYGKYGHVPGVVKLDGITWKDYYMVLFKTLDFPNPNRDNINETFILSCSEGIDKLVKVLINDLRVDPSILNNMALQLACVNNRIEIVKLLLNDPRVDPSDKENIVFRTACVQGNVEMVKILLEDSRVNPSDMGNHALRYSSKYGYLEIVNMILNDSRLDITRQKIRHFIRWAGFYGFEDIVKRLKEFMKTGK